ncbi:MAG: hypothetical protein HRT95_05740 [Moritella sp.]|uniref:hypothetical protein n=1 Tax=Moritella sp. TaxID=78556 RepID=UPI001D803ED4|nr:hypothetical protein [Moritella sp.]NQZ49693.1 hypothetical protein [Moritella sp.]
MTPEEYSTLILKWTDLVNKAGITLSNNKPVPTVFWKTFLGITRSVHLEAMKGTSRRKEFSPSLAQTIRFANKLDRNVFMEEVLIAIPLYESNKRK